MTAPFRFLAWLMLPALMLVQLQPAGRTAEGAPTGPAFAGLHRRGLPADGARRARSSMSPNTASRWSFWGCCRAWWPTCRPKPERAELVKGVDELRRAVTAHQDGATVARQARQLGAKLAVAYEVSQAPAITPDPTRGAPLYAQHCSVCHGTPARVMARRAWA